MYNILPLFLTLAAFTTTISAVPSPLWIEYSQRDAAATTPVPKLVVYVQTFHVNGNPNTPLSILPLLNDNTGVTHVIFAMTHLNSAPGDIHLNDDPYNSTVFAQAWSEGAQLQAAGIKLMVCIGGAGDGSFSHLEADVCGPCSFPIPPCSPQNILHS
jgi:hypothetical protein